MIESLLNAAFAAFIPLGIMLLGAIGRDAGQSIDQRPWRWLVGLTSGARRTALAGFPIAVGAIAATLSGPELPGRPVPVSWAERFVFWALVIGVPFWAGLLSRLPEPTKARATLGLAWLLVAPTIGGLVAIETFHRTASIQETVLASGVWVGIVTGSFWYSYRESRKPRNQSGVAPQALGRLPANVLVVCGVFLLVIGLTSLLFEPTTRDTKYAVWALILGGFAMIRGIRGR